MQPVAAAAAAPAPSIELAPGPDGPAKRRRRGGRNRKRDGVAVGQEPVAAQGGGKLAGSGDAPRGRHDARGKPGQRDHEQAHRKESGLKSLISRIRSLFRR